jgi:SAM-dependent methyltransferase
MAEPVACPVCAGPGARPALVRPDGARVLSCRACGLLFVCERERFSAASYRGAYFRQGGEAGIGYADYAGFATSAGKRRLDGAVLRALIPRMKGRRLLDVGCGFGHFLARAREGWGLEVAGCELSPEAAARARADFGLEVIVGTLGEAGCEAGRFDAVTYLDVLEHIADPGKELAEVRRVLTPEGVIALLTPNAACAGLLGKRRWSGFRQSFEHLNYFSRRSLGRALSGAGFEVVFSRTLEFPAALPVALARSRGGRPSGPGRALRRLAGLTLVPALERAGYGHLLLMIGRRK